MILAGSASIAAAQSGVADSATAIINDRPLGARIVGGGDAEPGEYPSVVALVRTGFGELDERLFCGGTLVARRWVLTAAHCVHNAFNRPLESDFFRVVAGINDLVDDTPEQEHSVLQIVIHPDYDGTLELPPNDIALIELQTEVANPEATLFTGDTNDFTGTFGSIAGWGAIEYSDPFNPEYPTSLQDAVVPLITNEVCNSPESYDGLIMDTHLCAGFADGKVDACAGDSGGPLFISVDGVQLQAGITSFGSGCGLPLFYGIYTNVSHFIPWMSEYIPVPFQSPELVAFRDEQKNRPPAAQGVNSDEGSSAGAFGQPVLWLFLLVAYRRVVVISGVKLTLR